MKNELQNLFEKMKVRSRYKPMYEIINMIEPIVNLEVEKRISERMPSDEEQDKWADYCAGNTTSDHNKAVLYKAALSLGATWLRSRLTCSEIPNNSKTDNLKENNNNGSTN